MKKLKNWFKTNWIILIPLIFVFALIWWMDYSPRAQLCHSNGGGMDGDGTCYKIMPYVPDPIINL